jgi:hypothetical protein
MLIYGEHCGLDFQMYAGIALAKATYYETQKERINADLAKVIEHNVNYWTAFLSPDADGYSHSLAASAGVPLQYCREHAKSLNRPQWGFKVPGWPVATTELVRHCLPNAKWVVIHRDIDDCLKSAKAWQAPYYDDMKEMTENWAASLHYWLAHEHNPQVLLLNYHDLLADPAPILKSLAEFTGATTIDVNVLAVKVNDWLHETDKGPSQYRSPNELTAAEAALVTPLDDLRHRLYGEKPSANSRP